MKTNFNFKSPKTLILLSAICTFLAFGLASCNKNSEPEPEVTGNAQVRAVHAAETSAPQDFYIDEMKLNSSAIVYTQNTAYYTIKAGARNTQFKTSGTTTLNVSGAIYFTPDSYNTVYFTDGNNGVVTADDPTPPQPNKARVRFINLSSALNANVDFGLSTGNKIVTGLAYKTASAYSEVDAATSFSLYASGSSTATLSIPTALQAGKIYTIIISGNTTATITYTVVAQN